MNRRVFVDIYNDIQMPCRFGSSFFIGVSTRTGLEICAYPFVGLNHNTRIILLYESSDNSAGRCRVYGAAAIVIIIVIPILPPAYSARRRQIHVFNIADRIPLTGIQSHARQRISIKPRININRIVSCACRDLRLIPDAGNPIRQRPHRHQIDEHQRRHQNGYKAFYFIPHCLILLFHLEAALPLLPDTIKANLRPNGAPPQEKIWEKRARHSCAPVSAVSATSSGCSACTTGGFFQLMLSTDTRQK